MAKSPHRPKGPHLIDITGRRFGAWTVIERTRFEARKPHWLCRCDCGSERVILGSNLRSGFTNSCGCLQKLLIGHVKSKHGRSNNITYSSWLAMKARCSNPRNSHFKYYGGRGIKVCARWAEDFEAFLVDMGERPSSAHSIERDDVNKDYEPGNCRWLLLVD